MIALRAIVLPFFLSRELRPALLLALQLSERLLVSVKFLLCLAICGIERPTFCSSSSVLPGSNFSALLMSRRSLWVSRCLLNLLQGALKLGGVAAELDNKPPCK